MKLIFLHACKRQRCLQISTTILSVCGVTNLLFLCNILRKKWAVKCIFNMQISMKACYRLILWFWWEWSRISKVPKIVCNISKKKLEMKLFCCMQISIKVSCKLISTLWASEFPARWCYSYWYARSSILKVLKVTSFQYLYNISKKVRNGVHFLHVDEHKSLYKLALSFLMEVARHVQST